MSRAGVAACLGLLLAGCSSMGPPTITRDRFDYVASISESWKRQMLLNLLKVRYSDAPVFLDVASVINSYEIQGQLAFGGQRAPADRLGDTFTALGVNGTYADRPTIAYTPLAGEKFAKSIMSPIPIGAVLLLVQSGYPIDAVFRVCLNTVNGLENSYGGIGQRAGDPGFHELITLLREDQTAGGLGMQIKSRRSGQATVLHLRLAADAAMAARHRRVIELLGLRANLADYAVVYGSFPENDTEIALQSRSMLQVLADMASYIEVPAADIAEGRVPAPRRSAEHEKMFPALMRVRSSSGEPKEAYVAVRYRERWFWIDDRDQDSKTYFSFLMQMFSLTETGTPGQSAPVVTVPAR